MAENIVVTKDERKYKTVVTDVGAEKIARAALRGEKVDIVEAVVTDGGGQYFLPTADMTELAHVVWRGPIANKEINAASANMIDVKIFLDGTVGGFTARGIGLLDSDGDLIAVCNLPDTAKAVLVDGIAATLTLIMHIVVTDTEALEFKIDPSVDMVSPAELEAAIEKSAGAILEQVRQQGAGGIALADGQTVEQAVTGLRTAVAAAQSDVERRVTHQELSDALEEAGGEIARQALDALLRVGDAEPAQGPALWFDTSRTAQLETAVLELGDAGDAGEIVAEIDGTARPVKNAGTEPPTEGTYQFNIL